MSDNVAVAVEEEEEEEEEGDTSPRHQPHYPDEDLRQTTQRELNGWFAYPVAAEVFAVVAVGAFLPVVLEQLARENGTLGNARGRACVGPQAGEAPGRRDGEPCVVRFLGRDMTTASFAMYTFSVAVLVQAVVLVCFSSFADHGPYRKKMLVAFAYTGSLASALFIFVGPSVYYLAPILVTVGVTSLGCSFVLLNAFLPLLVANHREQRTGISPIDSPADVELETFTGLDNAMPFVQSSPDTLSTDLELSAHLSSKGVGYGYASAVFVQILSILILWLFSKTEVQKRNPSFPIRFVLLVVGLWWAIFTIPTVLWLRPRPGRPLPTRHQGASHRWRKLNTLLFYTSFSLRSFWRTLRRAASLRQTLLFLLSWFLVSDAVATISGTAVLFARTELQMGTIAIASLSITSIGSGIVGALAWPRVQKYFSLQPKTVLLLCVAGMELIPLYGLLGYIPVFKRWGVIGLQQAWEIYPIAVLHGVIMGGISSYARTVYSPLVPEGREAAFFALYAVTDKGSSAFGPALVGWIVDRAGTIRPAFIFLATLVLLPVPLLWSLDIEKGREKARLMARGVDAGRGAYEQVTGDD